MHKARFSLAALAIVAIGFGAAYTLSRGLWRVATADDSTRTTSLQLDTDTFDPSVAPIAAVSSSISSSDENDTRVQIDFYYRPVNTYQDTHVGTMWADRSGPGAIGVKYQLPQGEFNSGTTVRAQFATFSGSSTSFVYSRYVQLP